MDENRVAIESTLRSEITEEFIGGLKNLFVEHYIDVPEEKIDVVEWSENASDYVKEALKPAQILAVKLFEEENRAEVQVAEDQQSLAIGRGGQNVRLAARLTGWKIDIRAAGGTEEEKSESAAAEAVSEAPTVENTEK